MDKKKFEKHFLNAFWILGNVAIAITLVYYDNNLLKIILGILIPFNGMMIGAKLKKMEISLISFLLFVGVANYLAIKNKHYGLLLIWDIPPLIFIYFYLRKKVFKKD